ncbi:MAG: small ribosomal subunit Rsm22 family protein [Spirochaetaceae bacterium]|jgi:hypothetical protein|nr:small ribosomal subunit Rsm22 family protein [Spirochaetaceae bacterium]
MTEAVFAPPPPEARQILASYDEVIRSVWRVPVRKERRLPQEIRALARAFTGERGTRRMGYLNDPAQGAAYVRYYHWWNLLRLTRLFAALPEEAFPVPEGGVCVDIGSGPLTAVSALYLARPALRDKNITWYCVDRSRQILERGEELFFALQARMMEMRGKGEWRILRVQGGPETPLRQKANLLVAANVFNEIIDRTRTPLEDAAGRAAGRLCSRLRGDASLLVIEPGTPRPARFLHFLRGCLLERGFSPIAPCVHSGPCPMDGGRGGKWCHFVFSSADAPDRLRSLSDEAGLPKERAALSFAAFGAGREEDSRGPAKGGPLPARITADVIRLPGGRAGLYGCSEAGLTLVELPGSVNPPVSGTLVSVRLLPGLRDKKTNAVMAVFAKV